MAYSHGVYVSEVPTSVTPAVSVSAGLPVVFGSAPVNLTDDPSATLNTPQLIYTYSDAVTTLGFMAANDNGIFDYTLCEFMKSHFSLFSVAPIVFVNVLDPDTHKADVTAETITLASDQATLANTGVLLSTVVVKSSDGTTTYVEDTDYTVTFNDDGESIVYRLDDGAIAESAELQVDYSHLDPSLVDSDDIIGGVSVTTGKLTGLELIDEVFPRFRLVPGLVVAPGFSSDPTVSAVMKSKVQSINGHFKAISLTDIPTDEVTKYTDAPAWKNNNNVVGEFEVACYPKVKLGDEQYHLSTQLAGLICQVDGNNSDIPYKSPSNQSLQMDSAVLVDGTEVWLAPDTAAYLNGEGIVTALNFIGGWKAWGNRTAIYPSSTDPKDAFLPVRRMFNWVGNTLTQTFWGSLDYPLNRRQIDTVVDSVNLWLNGLVSQQYLIGGRVEFLAEENSTTDLMDGIARFHVYLTPPSPNREIDFILEYDADYLDTLFS